MSLSGFILLVIVLVDTLVTVCGINAGRLVELNPLAAWLMQNAGLLAFVFFKAMFVLLLVAHLDRKLRGTDDDKALARRSYLIATIFYALYFILPWLSANHKHLQSLFSS